MDTFHSWTFYQARVWHLFIWNIYEFRLVPEGKHTKTLFVYHIMVCAPMKKHPRALLLSVKITKTILRSTTLALFPCNLPVQGLQPQS